MQDSSTQQPNVATQAYWRAATLGTPTWMVAIVATYYLIAPVVEAVLPDTTRLPVVVFVSVAVIAVVSGCAAAVLHRTHSEVRRGFAVGMVAAVAIALTYAGVHLAVNTIGASGGAA